MSTVSLSDVWAVSPAIVVTLGAFLILLVGLFVRSWPRWIARGLAMLALLGAGTLTVRLHGQGLVAFSGLFLADDFALVFNLIFLLAATLCVLLADNLYERSYLLYTEFLALVLFAVVGMMLMAGSNHLLTIFLGVETLSISLYILAGFKRSEARSLESAFKYFLLGAFASGFLLYGIAFIFGATGSFDLAQVAHGLAAGSPAFLVLGGILVIVGLGFKVAMVPFHMWTPDVYEGAPTPVTAFMATGSKAAGFAALLRVLFAATDGVAADWTLLLAIVSALTMTIGNVAALVQTQIKRMLAYSSIAHAGYLLVGVVAWNETGVASVMFYLLAYTFMNVGAFAVVAYSSVEKKEALTLDDYRGLAFEKPGLALVMAIFMFALAGLPPTVGFVGKFYLFSAAVKAGQVPLVIIGVVNSMISLYYYLGVVVVMFMKEAPQAGDRPKPVRVVSWTLAVTALGTVALGIFPSDLMAYLHAVVTHIL